MFRRRLHTHQLLRCGLLGLALWSCSARVCAAEDERWNPQFTRFTTAQYVIGLTGTAGWIASTALLPTSDKVHWQSEILLDHAARNALRADTESGRKTASSFSDVLAVSVVLYPFAVDALLTAGVIHDNYDVALQMVLIGAQSIVLGQLVTSLTKGLVGRARPDYDGCKDGTELACHSRNQSFISGHSSFAFTGAGLICATQQNLRPYGSGIGGAVACGVGLGVATTVATLRIVADRHYSSDVLAGALVGVAAGYLLPNLTNFDFGKSARGSLTPLAGRGTVGLQYLSQF